MEISVDDICNLHTFMLAVLPPKSLICTFQIKVRKISFSVLRVGRDDNGSEVE